MFYKPYANALAQNARAQAAVSGLKIGNYVYLWKGKAASGAGAVGAFREVPLLGLWHVVVRCKIGLGYESVRVSYA